jgi:hypothetical protein
MAIRFHRPTRAVSLPLPWHIEALSEGGFACGERWKTGIKSKHLTFAPDAIVCEDFA